jgi:uncharacterized protein YjbI with pentapeptide repeats
MSKTFFNNCKLKDADFAEADLSSSKFDNSDLEGVIFENTILEKCDFRSAINFIIDPEKNKVKKAKFSAAGLAGLLSKYQLDIE